MNLVSNSEHALLLQSLRIPSSVYYGLYDFAFDDIHMEDDETLTVSISTKFNIYIY